MDHLRELIILAASALAILGYTNQSLERGAERPDCSKNEEVVWKPRELRIT